MAGAVSWFGRSRPSANDALAAVEAAAAKDAVAKAETEALQARLTKLKPRSS
jgi:hypothetical protein